MPADGARARPPAIGGKTRNEVSRAPVIATLARALTTTTDWARRPPVMSTLPRASTRITLDTISVLPPLMRTAARAVTRIVLDEDFRAVKDVDTRPAALSAPRPVLLPAAMNEARAATVIDDECEIVAVPVISTETRALTLIAPAADFRPVHAVDARQDAPSVAETAFWPDSSTDARAPAVKVVETDRWPAMATDARADAANVVETDRAPVITTPARAAAVTVVETVFWPVIAVAALAEAVIVALTVFWPVKTVDTRALTLIVEETVCVPVSRGMRTLRTLPGISARTSRPPAPRRAIEPSATGGAASQVRRRRSP